MNGSSGLTRVVIVDDHPVLRAGLRQVIESDAHFRVVAEAGTGEEGLAHVRQLVPGIVVLDQDLPGIDGLETARRLTQGGYHMPRVLLTMHRRESLLNDALAAGFTGYVLKDNAVADLLACLRAVVRGKRWFSPAVSDFLAHHRSRRDSLVAARPGIEQLSPAESRILRLVAEGLTSREIGDRLGVSPLTIQTHRKNISRKLGLEGQHSLLQFAHRHRDVV